MMLKKTLSLCLAAIVLLGSMSLVSATIETEPDSAYPFQHIIKEQVSSLTGIPAEDLQIVETDNTGFVSRNKSSAHAELALQATTNLGNGKIEKKIIIPKIAVEGGIINSFEYAEEQLAQFQSDAGGIMPRDAHFPKTLVNLTLNFSCYYNVNVTDVLLRLYTPKSVYFSWSSSDSAAAIRDINVSFEGKGDLWSGTPFKNQGRTDQFVFGKYQENPSKGTVYGYWQNPWADNRAIAFSDPFDHGLWVLWSINYRVNGSMKYDSGTITVASK